MKYFRFFPKLDYDLDDDGQTKSVIDLFRFAKIINAVTDDITFYRNYDIQDGERPDHVSQKLYGTTDYHWTFFIANPEMKSLYTGWPRSREEMESYVEDTYPDHVLNIDSYNFFNQFEVGETIQGLISGATATVVSKDVNLGWMKITNKVGTFSNNEIVRGLVSGDFETIAGEALEKNAAHHYEQGGYIVERSPTAAIITFEQYEIDKNDTKRTIRVLRPEYVGQVASQFREAINER